jgi:hypothetical protein
VGKQYTVWTLPENEDRLRKAAANNVSISGMCRELGIAPRGGNIHTIRHHITRLNIDTSHHLGQSWNWENYAKPESRRNKNTLRAALIREHGHRCWQCGLSEWLGQPIPLEMDHIDGNNTNNELDNLRILCANCHSLTPTFRNKKRK